MFGYVTPCKMELKIKDYEKFKAYYCGLCQAIKHNFGNIPRFALNYDMTFLAILIDSLSEEPREFKQIHCAIHPIKKRVMIVNNEALNYASFCNVILAYYKYLDDVEDNNSFKGRIFSKVFNIYINKTPNFSNKAFLDEISSYSEKSLKELNYMEKHIATVDSNLDKISHPFADLTGFLISSYFKEEAFKEKLYFLGYNLGKWIYIIDAWDDLETDMKNKKFNAINALFNNKNMSFIEFSKEIETRIDFTLVTCASFALKSLKELSLKRNEELLLNILQYGLMEKMDKVFKRSEVNEGSI